MSLRTRLSLTALETRENPSVADPIAFPLPTPPSPGGVPVDTAPPAPTPPAPTLPPVVIPIPGPVL